MDDDLPDDCFQRFLPFKIRQAKYRQSARARALQKAQESPPETEDSSAPLSYRKRLRALKARLLKKGVICPYCLHPMNAETFSWDHILPRYRGGSNALKNLRPCCKDCNHKKGSLPEAEFWKQLVASA